MPFQETTKDHEKLCLEHGEKKLLRFRRRQRRGDEKCGVVLAAEKVTGIVPEKREGCLGVKKDNDDKIYRRLDSCLVIPPPKGKKPKAIIKFLGGASIGAIPEVTYSYLLGLLANEGYLIISIPYNMTFDHSQAAREVLEKFHSCLNSVLTYGLPKDDLLAAELVDLPLYSVGHSNGALLQVLVDAWKALLDTAEAMAPDYDPETRVSLNKFVAQGISEFKPTPTENRECCKNSYNVLKTLLVKFNTDAIDETDLLEETLKPRVEAIGGTLDIVSLSGNHMTLCIQVVIIKENTKGAFGSQFVLKGIVICQGNSVRVLFSFGVAPYNDATLEDLKTNHPFKPPSSLSHISIDHHHLVASPTVVLDRIKTVVAISDELVSSITQVVNLFLAGNCPQMLGEYIVSAPLTPLVKPGGGIRPIVVGIVWRRLVSKVSASMIGHYLYGYLDGLQFGVGVASGSEAILYSVNHLIEACGDEVEFCYSNPARLYYGEHTLWSCQGVQQGDPLGPLLFALVLHPLICKIRDSFSLSLHAWYLDDGTIVGDTMFFGKVLELITKDGPGCGLHLNIDKTGVFWPKEDPRSRLVGIFPPNIAQSLHGVKLLGGPASVDFDFCNELVMKRVTKTIGLMDATTNVNDPQCELLLLRSCKGISRLYFTLRTCPPRVFEPAQRYFDVALRIPLFFVSKPCSVCSRVFAGDIYEDHALSCAGIIGIKHRHNVVRDTLVDICYRSGISAGKEVDIGLDGGRDKSLRPSV
ncbi:putative reverse transcriptase domain-containing protein [Tanacetum coccineum]